MFNVNTLKLAVRDLAVASVLDELDDRAPTPRCPRATKTPDRS